MSKKNIIYFFILFSLVIVAMNLNSIFNLYQNIFYSNVCTDKFCIKKPKDYTILGIVQNGVSNPFIPIKKFEKKTSQGYGIFLSHYKYKYLIIVSYLRDTDKIDRFIKKYKLKKDKNIKECYNATRVMNYVTKLNDKIFLICVNKKIRISQSDKIDYKTLQYILDNIELKK